ncbi:MAG: uracil phosphoribosyltransferase [Bacteroidota bacterium]
MKDFFYGIQDLFVNVLFAPLDLLRSTELENWFLANGLNWTFMLVGSVAFIYWMRELSKYNKSGEEDKSVTAHSYL